MLTSNVQLGYILTRGGGQAVQGGLSCPHLEFQRDWIIHKFYHTIGVGGQAVQGGLFCPPPPSPPKISQRKDNQQLLLHLFQKYLVDRDINLISVNMKCLLQTFSWVTYWQGVGGKLSRAVYLVSRPEFQREWMIRKFYYTICYRNI